MSVSADEGVRLVPTNRRSFLRVSAAAGGALALGGFDAAQAHAAPFYRGLPDVPAATRALRILILGGTGFTGPFQVRYAVARGHHVTVFNRGRRDADLPEGVVHLQGDRSVNQLDALKGQTWDVVIDNPTSLPFWVRDAAEVLRNSTNHYVFISTISVYDPRGQTRITEDSPLAAYTGGDPLAVTQEQFSQNVGELYGPMKAASEAEARKQFGDRTMIIRPGLIVGPGDQSDRFTYWPLRIERGGEIMAPGDGEDPIQIIDARDLAEWTIRSVEGRVTGTFNATGPRGLFTMAQQLYGIRAALPGDTDLRFTWIPAEFLAQHEVQPWGEMTTWFGSSGDGAVLSSTSIDRAIAQGLTFRPLAVTTVDTLAWYRTLPAERQAQPRAGIAAEKEQKVLAAWHASRTG
jgi:2'-hydroxyisoflavone reductase